jgi:hypothetical protein
MLGFVSGVVLSIVYRNDGPTEPVYEWMLEDDEDEADKGEESEKEEKKT